MTRFARISVRQRLIRLAGWGRLAACLLVWAPAAAMAGEHAPRQTGAITFVHCPALTANVQRANGRWGVVTIEAGLDISDEKLRILAQKSIPRLRDAYTRVLMEIAPRLPAGETPDLDRIGAALQKATDQVLGRPGAHFLLGSVIVN